MHECPLCLCEGKGQKCLRVFFLQRPEQGWRQENTGCLVFPFGLVVVVSPGSQAEWPPVCSSGVWSHGYHAEITNTRVDTAVSSWTKRVKKKMKGRLCEKAEHMGPS